jgi:hypothetical protein
MTATVSESIHIPRATWYRAPVKDVKNVESGGVSGEGVDRARLPWRWRTALTDCVALLALAWSIPFAILLVGTPVALAIVLLLWLGRLALSAF